MKKFKIDEHHHRMRADVFLAAQYPRFARAALAKLFKADMVSINGMPEKAGYKLRGGEIISVDDSWLVETEIEDIALPIIYEDDDVLVIDKPAGILSHSRGGLTREASVASFLRHHVDKSMSGERAGIVHRLDRATSGVMVCAKNEIAMRFLQKQFQDRRVKKTYVAITKNAPKHQSALIDAPIGRDVNSPKKFKVDPHGKKSQTKYHVSKLHSGNYKWTVEPFTGRTHQIRVHLRYLDCPIIGDVLYGGVSANRLYLHASQITINLPDHRNMSFTSPTPRELVR